MTIYAKYRQYAQIGYNQHFTDQQYINYMLSAKLNAWHFAEQFIKKPNLP